MIGSAYKMLSGEVRVHEEESMLSEQEFQFLKSHFQTEKDYLYAKFDTVHIPVRSQPTLSKKPVISITKADADKFDIDESSDKSFMIANPDRLRWFDRS